LINVRGRRRAVIIIPELNFNSGWTGIAEKVGRFISSHKHGGNLEKHRLVDNNISYANMLRSTKWGNEGRKNTQTANMAKRGDKICIYEDLNSQSDVLKKSLVGKFMVSKGETPNLTEVRKWENNLWKQIHDLNIYEIGKGIFLFEFTSKTTAKQLVEGDWVWKNFLVKMQW